MNVKCEQCRKFYGTEVSVSKDFRDGYKGDIDTPTGITFRPPSLRIQSSCGFIKMCQHPSCFETINKSNPEKGDYIEKKRVKGQGQLNENNRCNQFKKAYWRFWA